MCASNTYHPRWDAESALHTCVSFGPLTACWGGKSGYYLSFIDKPTKTQRGEEACWRSYSHQQYGIGQMRFSYSATLPVPFSSLLGPQLSESPFKSKTKQNKQDKTLGCLELLYIKIVMNNNSNNNHSSSFHWALSTNYTKCSAYSIVIVSRTL